MNIVPCKILELKCLLKSCVKSNLLHTASPGAGFFLWGKSLMFSVEVSCNVLFFCGRFIYYFMFYAKFQTWMFHECLNSACVPHLHLFIQYLLYWVSILNNDTFMFVCLGLCICVLVFVYPMIFCIKFCFVSNCNFEQRQTTVCVSWLMCLCPRICSSDDFFFVSSFVLYWVSFCISFQFWTVT